MSDIERAIAASNEMLARIEQLEAENEKLRASAEYWALQAGNYRQELECATATIDRQLTDRAALAGKEG